jgi:membrane protein implicated in regulation of membrane protease activity
MATPILFALSRLLPSALLRPMKTLTAIATPVAPVDEWATVTVSIKPGKRGRVSFQATEWFAICLYCVELPSDTPVRVIEINNTTLIVEPLPLVMPGSLASLHVA